MVCRYCKQELPDNAIFCGYCGKRLVEDSKPPVPPVSEKPNLDKFNTHPGKQKNKMLITAIVTITLLLALFFALPGFFEGKDKSNTNIINNDSVSNESSDNEKAESIAEENLPEGQLKQKTIIKTKPDGTLVSKSILKYDDHEREIAGSLFNKDGKLKKTWEISYISLSSPEYTKIENDSYGNYLRTESMMHLRNGDEYDLDIYIQEENDRIPLYIGECTYRNGLMIERVVDKVIDYSEYELSAKFESFRTYEYKNDKLIKEKKYTINNYNYDENGNYIGKIDLPDDYIKGWIEYEYNDKGYKNRAIEYDKNGNIKYFYDYENEYY